MDIKGIMLSEKASSKVLTSILFHLYNIFEVTKLRDMKIAVTGKG